MLYDFRSIDARKFSYVYSSPRYAAPSEVQSQPMVLREINLYLIFLVQLLMPEGYLGSQRNGSTLYGTEEQSSLYQRQDLHLPTLE